MARLIRAPAGAGDDHIESRGTPGTDIVHARATPHHSHVGRGVALGRGAGLLALWCLAVAAPGADPALAEVVGRPSVGLAGAEGNGNSYSADLSGDGRFVAFTSEASNLVRGDTNGDTDVFVRDRTRQVTTRVSVGPGGAQAYAQSGLVSISRDGRFVAFTSYSSRLVAGDTNDTNDAFVHDRRTGATRRVSVAGDGTQGNGESAAGPLSADGRFAVFTSRATNLVPGDTNGVQDVFVHELSSGRTERVSVGVRGAQGNAYSDEGAISADGRFVGFWSEAGNLVSGDTNRQPDVFVRDRRAGTTERVSVGPRGRQANGPSSRSPSLSADGRVVVFSSDATNLVAGDTNGMTDVFVRDRETGRTTRVSVRTGGAQGDRFSWANTPAALSADGRRVAFLSAATNLVPGDTTRVMDVFVHDRGTGETRRVSVAPGGAQSTGDHQPQRPAISDDGRFVSFFSGAPNLWPGDTNELLDVFVAKTR